MRAQVVSPVDDHERLARFILFSGWFRKSELSVKPEAFVPHPYPDLSVTRHGELAERELWDIGKAIADFRPSATLYGRADIDVAEIRKHSLNVLAAPVKNNPNHANITGWPSEKPIQKALAQRIAAKAIFVAAET